MMKRIDIKPLSVNQAWQGRRFKTRSYHLYERILLSLLPDSYPIPKGKICAYYKFGLSSKNADCDNLIKPFQDILSKKYGFDDKRIYCVIAKKIDEIGRASCRERV